MCVQCPHEEQPQLEHPELAQVDEHEEQEEQSPMIADLFSKI